MNILGVKDVRQKLNCSAGFVQKIINNGELKSFKIGRKRATTEEFLNDYINKQIMEAENERTNTNDRS